MGLYFGHNKDEKCFHSPSKFQDCAVLYDEIIKRKRLAGRQLIPTVNYANETSRVGGIFSTPSLLQLIVC